MLLAIDSGNTNVVCAVYDGDNLRGSWRAGTNPNRTADEYAVWLIQLMALAGLGLSDIDATIIGSVVPEATHNLARLCERYFSCEPLIVGRPDCSVGIGIELDMPREEVGADRIANAVAAQDRYRPPLIVIDFGTATTFDAITAAGEYRGGVIAPGLFLSAREGKSGRLRAERALGRGLLRVAPWLMKLLSVAGTAAMFLVGGGILTHDVPALHHAIAAISPPGVLGAVVGLLADLVVGVIVGAIVLGVVKLIGRLWRTAAGNKPAQQSRTLMQ